MRKKLFVLIVIFSLLISGMLIAIEGEAFDKESAGGYIRGAVSDTKEITDWYDLDAVRDDLDGDYVLMKDLDEDTEGYDELVETEDGWEPLGDDVTPFEGTFNGNSLEIRDLYINRTQTNYVGLFGSIDGRRAEISNLGLVEADVNGFWYVGGLVGYNDGIVSNSYATGNIRGDTRIGGLIGDNEGTVSNSYSRGNVSGDGFRVGGLVGYNYHGTVSNSYMIGNVSGNDGFVGGLVGYNYLGTVFDSYASGNVSGEEQNVGGLVGSNWKKVSNSYARVNVSGGNRVGGLVGDNRDTVNNSYATGNVSGGNRVGGLVGDNQDTVKNSYSTGNVSGDTRIGGLIGNNDGSVSDSFWDLDTSGQNESEGGTGKTTEEMKDVATYTDTDTYGLEEPWDFLGNPNDDEGDEDIWDIDEDEIINEGYPLLAWEIWSELTIYIEGEGTVEVDNEEVEDGWTEIYEDGASLSLEVFPDEGWYFEEWTGDYTGNEEQINITMDKDKELTARFDIKTYDLTVDIVGEGSIEKEPYKEEYEHGKEVNLTAIPDEGWYFEEWSGDNQTIEDTKANETTIEMLDNYTITAQFSVNIYDLNIESTEGGEVEKPGEGMFEYEFGEEVNLTAVPDEGYHFSEWTGDHTGTEEQITITMDEDKEIMALFEEYATLKIEDITGDGTVKVDGEVIETPIEKNYERGEEAELSVDPDEGWYFEEWTGDHTGTEEQITITMDEDKEITAVFKEYATLKIEDITGDGTVKVDGEVIEAPFEKNYERGEEAELLADPDEGWYFKEWEGIAEEDADITITMVEDKEITANFEEDGLNWMIIIGIIAMIMIILAIIGYVIKKSSEESGSRREEEIYKSSLPVLKKKKNDDNANLYDENQKDEKENKQEEK